jgi:hypothetical protein
MKTKLFYIGLAIISISFVVCVYSFFLLFFGIPPFLLGAILVFLSNRSIRTKLLTTIAPIVLYLPFTFVFLYIYNYSTPKTILIPKDYNGHLRVVYEEKCGQKYGNADGMKTLTFPENGILVLNEDFDTHINYHYYFVDEFGNRTKIPQIHNFSDSVKVRPSILVTGSGTFIEDTLSNSTNQEKRAIKFSDFYVYDKGIIESNHYETTQKFDSLTTIIVNQCRYQNN